MGGDAGGCKAILIFPITHPTPMGFSPSQHTDISNFLKIKLEGE